MALKDWKKLKATSPSIFTWNKWTGRTNKQVDVWKPTRLDTEYSVWTSANKQSKFKTKIQALKFAKAYMRTH